MTNEHYDDLGDQPSGSKKGFLKNINVRPYLMGMLPLFLLAHFGHHGIGAMLNPLAPLIRNDLGLSLTEFGFVTMAFTLTAGLSQLPAGMIADKVGIRVMVLLGVAGVALGGFLIGFTNSLLWLIVFMVFAALMGGGYHPASAAAISSSTQEKYRGRALGLHLIGGTSAFWIFPLIATPMAAAWGWRSPYLAVSVPLMILGVALYFIIGRKMKQIEARKREQPEEEIEVFAQPDSIQWGKIVPFIVVSVLTGAIVQSVSSYLVFYATDQLGVSDSTAGYLTSITPAVGLIGAPLGGWIGDKFGGIKVILAVSILSAPVVYFMGVAPTVPVLVFLMIAMGLLMNTRMPTSESYLTSNVPEKRRGTIMGIYYFSGTGVSAPFAPVVGSIIERLGFARTFGFAGILTAIVSGLCAVALWWNNNRYKKYPEITG